MASDKNMKAANNTYSSFISMLKWATPVALLATAFVVYLIS